jgi:hypothetical protein
VISPFQPFGSSAGLFDFRPTGFALDELLHGLDGTVDAPRCSSAAVTFQ